MTSTDSHSPDAQCPWCGRAAPPGRTTCPACGAPSAVPTADPAGWVELPGIPDGTALRVGSSRLGIQGSGVPVAEFDLAEGDGLYFTHAALLWKDLSVRIARRVLEGGWKRTLAGMPLVLVDAFGPGHIAFSRDLLGALWAVPLDPGQSVDAREHALLVATGAVGYEAIPTEVWYQTASGDERETHYPLGQTMDRFTGAESPGWVLLHGAGSLFRKTLGAGETLLVQPNALLYKDSAVEMQLHVDEVQSGSGFFAGVKRGGRYLWLRLKGPGQVAIHSAAKQGEEVLGALVKSSGTTGTW